MNKSLNSRDACDLKYHDINNNDIMTSSNGNLFCVTGLLCEDFTSHRWMPRTKGQWRWPLMFSLVCAWTNSWANNGDTGDLRYHHAHYDVSAMMWAPTSLLKTKQVTKVFETHTIIHKITVHFYVEHYSFLQLGRNRLVVRWLLASPETRTRFTLC